jgi:hypothetical protein
MGAEFREFADNTCRGAVLVVVTNGPAASIMGSLFILDFVVAPLLPETRGQPPLTPIIDLYPERIEAWLSQRKPNAFGGRASRAGQRA